MVLTWRLSTSAPGCPGHKPGDCGRGSSSSTEPCYYFASTNDHHACMYTFAETWARMCLTDAALMSGQSPQPPILHGPTLPELRDLIPSARQLLGESGSGKETPLHPVPDPKLSMSMGNSVDASNIPIRLSLTVPKVAVRFCSQLLL